MDSGSGRGSRYRSSEAELPVVVGRFVLFQHYEYSTGLMEAGQAFLFLSAH